jgi:hypothetical protein
MHAPCQLFDPDQGQKRTGTAQNEGGARKLVRVTHAAAVHALVQCGVQIGSGGATLAAPTAMKLEPYQRVDDLPFTATMDEVRRRHGVPQRETRNDVELNELDYGDVVFRFQDNGRLEEVTGRVKVLQLPGVAVPYASLAGFVREQDAEAFRVGGLYVSPRFGLAFDPADSNWVTALAAHCLPQWRALAQR